MAQDELDHLLEAFAADTLTPEERQRLQAAALRDPRLLSALADEQALKEVLRDPPLRSRLLWELRTGGGRKQWWRRRWFWAAAGSAVAAVAAVLVGTQLYQVYQDRLEDPLKVERDDSAPDSTSFPTPAPESNLATPGSKDEAPSPSGILNKPDVDRHGTRDAPVERQDSEPTSAAVPVPNPEFDSQARGEASRSSTDKAGAARPPVRRKPAPFTEPMVEERVRDDEIRASTALRRKEPQDRPAPKKPNQPARSRAGPPVDAESESESDAPQSDQETVHDEAVPQPPAEPASPAEQHAALSAPSSRSVPAPQRRSARALFYGEPDQVASAAALHSSESAQDSRLRTALAIRYSLVLAGPDGTDREVEPETPVGVSDRPRLAVQTNQDGYLLVMETPSDSDIGMAPQIVPKPVHARETTLYPLAGLMTDPEVNPVIRLRLIFASQLPDAKNLLIQTGAAPLEERSTSAPGGQAEHAVYAAILNESKDATLVVDLTLSQRH